MSTNKSTNREEFDKSLSEICDDSNEVIDEFERLLNKASRLIDEIKKL